MPRSPQSREGSIISYFATTPLEIAQVVLKLAQDTLRTRVQRSAEAKARAAGSRPKPVDGAAPGKPVKAKKRKRRTRAQMAAAQGASVETVGAPE